MKKTLYNFYNCVRTNRFSNQSLKKITWVGVDSGEYYLLEKRSSILYVSGDSINTKNNLSDFQIELIRVSSKLTNNIRNLYIRKEGVFIDLLNSLENAKTVI